MTGAKRALKEHTMRTMITFAVLCTVAAILASTAHAQTGPYLYYPLTPCRVVDTRNPNSTNGGPAFLGATQRDFQIRGNCGVPTTAKAVTLNVTVVNAMLQSWLTLWPSNVSRPYASTINFDAASVTPALANGAVVPLSANTLDLSVYNSEGSVNVILDVTGYFQ